MQTKLTPHYLTPKLYVGGWYILRNPFNQFPLTVGKVVVTEMFNIYLN